MWAGAARHHHEHPQGSAAAVAHPLQSIPSRGGCHAGSVSLVGFQALHEWDKWDSRSARVSGITASRYDSLNDPLSLLHKSPRLTPAPACRNQRSLRGRRPPARGMPRSRAWSGHVARARARCPAARRRRPIRVRCAPPTTRRGPPPPGRSPPCSRGASGSPTASPSRTCCAAVWHAKTPPNRKAVGQATVADAPRSLSDACDRASLTR